MDTHNAITRNCSFCHQDKPIQEFSSFPRKDKGVKPRIAHSCSRSMTRTEYASYRNVSRAYVSLLVAKGRAVLTRDGDIAVVETDNELDLRLDSTGPLGYTPRWLQGPLAHVCMPCRPAYALKQQRVSVKLQPTKRTQACKSCGMHDYYHLWPRDGDGYPESLCVGCQQGNRPDVPTKPCCSCGDRKPLDEFYRRGERIDSVCRKCAGKQTAKWQREHPRRKRNATERKGWKRFCLLCECRVASADWPKTAGGHPKDWCAKCETLSPEQRESLKQSSAAHRKAREKDREQRRTLAERKGIPIETEPRACRRCGEVKAIDQYARSSGGWAKTCYACEQEVRRESRRRRGLPMGRTAEEKREYRRKVAEREGRTLAFRPVQSGPEYQAWLLVKLTERLQRAFAKIQRQHEQAKRAAEKASKPVPARYSPEQLERIRAAARGQYKDRLIYERFRVKVYRYADPSKMLRSSNTERWRRIIAQNDGTLTREILWTLFSACSSCPYCGCLVDYLNASLDHIEPIVLGGVHGVSNVLICCAMCNSTKSDMPFAQWLAKLAPEHQQQARAMQRAARGKHSGQMLMELRPVS